VTTETEIPFCMMLEERKEPCIDYKDWEYCHQYYLKNLQRPVHKTEDSCDSL
jgi:hypothetical protein